MKVLITAAVLVAMSASAFAGAAREARPQADTTVAVIADAGRLSSAGLTSLNDSGRWEGAPHATADDTDLGALTTQLDTGSMLVALGVLGFALSRPIARRLRRKEQERRASALASTLQGRQQS